MKRISVRKQYNLIADVYLKERDKFQNIQYLERLNALLQPNSRILDIGCGAGIPIDAYFIDKGHRVTGIDISERQIELARKNLPEGYFIVEDMTRLRRGEYHVDAVVSFYAIIHVSRKRHAGIFRKIHSYLDKDGLLLVTMGVSDWEGTEPNFFGSFMSWSHYDAHTNIQLVRNAGFEIIFSEIDSLGGEKHLVILARKQRTE